VKLSHPPGILSAMATDGDLRLADDATRHQSIFRIEDARDAGLSESQIRRRATDAWHRMHDGIFRVSGAAATWRSELLGAAWARGDGAVISHRTAAALYEVPGARRAPIEITCHRWDRPQLPAIVAHEQRRLPAADITEVDGIPIVTPELLVLQLAWWKPSPNYIEAVIHALRRKRLISYSSMHATFLRHARRGLRGVASTRIALERWNPAGAPTESEMETLLLQTLRAHDLPPPVLQFEVSDRHGQFVARTDAALPQWRITVEYQSMQEHLDEFQIAADDRRRNRIIAAGYWPLVARIGDLRNGGDDLAEEIRAVAGLRTGVESVR
jgi:hypothetical protein